jgi:hypothetical protein
MFTRESEIRPPLNGHKFHKIWVPHPRDVFAFVARVGNLDPQHTRSSGAACEGSALKIRLSPFRFGSAGTTESLWSWVARRAICDCGCSSSIHPASHPPKASPRDARRIAQDEILGNVDGTDCGCSSSIHPASHPPKASRRDARRIAQDEILGNAATTTIKPRRGDRTVPRSQAM